MPKSSSAIVKRVAVKVKLKFLSEGTGHDWYHIERVYKAAKYIARREKGADVFIVELAALLHDIADWKFSGGDFNVGSKAAAKLLKNLNLTEPIIRKVSTIVDQVSFKGAGENNSAGSLEAKIVQDADRLDALGAIGIARAFAMGGYWQRPIYDPNIKPKANMRKAEYKKSKKQGTSINHFYEKLLLLKDRMNTKTGKKLALSRHAFLKKYLKEFLAEWRGLE